MGKIIMRTYVYIHELSLKEIKSYEQLFLTAVPGFVRAFCLPSDKTIYTKKSVCIYIYTCCIRIEFKRNKVIYQGPQSDIHL